MADLGHDPDAASADEKTLVKLDKALEGLTAREELLTADVQGMSDRVLALAAVEKAGDPQQIQEALTGARKAARSDDRKRERLRVEAETARDHLEAVEGTGPDAPCPICKKPYGEEYESIVASYRERLAGIKEELPKLEPRIDEAERRVERLAENLAAARSCRRGSGGHRGSQGARAGTGEAHVARGAA